VGEDRTGVRFRCNGYRQQGLTNDGRETRWVANGQVGNMEERQLSDNGRPTTSPDRPSRGLETSRQAAGHGTPAEDRDPDPGT
jgi:hypothetical protein